MFRFSLDDLSKREAQKGMTWTCPKLCLSGVIQSEQRPGSVLLARQCHVGATPVCRAGKDKESSSFSSNRFKKLKMKTPAGTVPVSSPHRDTEQHWAPIFSRDLPKDFFSRYFSFNGLIILKETKLFPFPLLAHAHMAPNLPLSLGSV